MDEPTKNKRGGYRPGAHRPRLYTEALVKQTIRISIDHTLTLSKINPNLSKSIRAILDDPILSKKIQEFIKRNGETK